MGQNQCTHSHRGQCQDWEQCIELLLEPNQKTHGGVSEDIALTYETLARGAVQRVKGEKV